MDNKRILEQNGKSWDVIADDWFGVTALPTYGPFTPKEDELNLFEDIKIHVNDQQHKITQYTEQEVKIKLFYVQ